MKTPYKSLLVMLMLTLAMIYGCSKGADPNTQQSNTTEETQTVTGEEERTTETPPQEEEVNLNVKKRDFTWLPSCTTNELFSVSPLNIDIMNYIIPLGHVWPPSGHIIPTGHIYLNLNTNNPVYAPGNMHIVRVYQQTNLSTGIEDIMIFFMPCRELQGAFYHVASISDDVKQKMGAYADNECETAGSVRNCAKDIQLEVRAGDLLGSAGGVAGQANLDFALFDLRIPAHPFINTDNFPDEPNGFDYLHAVCPVDYFAAGETKTELQNKFSKKKDPVCGTFMYDVAGTAQGNWYKSGETNETANSGIALVPYWDDPDLPMFSIGNGVATMDIGIYFVDDVRTSGLINRDFSDVKYDGNLYCYEGIFGAGVSGVVLLQMTSDSTIKIEKIDGSLLCDVDSNGTIDHAITSNASEFVRK